jgi:uncharacterized membrane protein YjgN (DUF898 family)
MESRYTAGVLDTLIAGIVASLIMGCTFGIATPWAVTYFLKFIFDHTTIDGKKLTFVGNGADLFGQWIIWALLTAVTCGIYSFWVAPKMYNWIAKNTHFAN